MVSSHRRALLSDKLNFDGLDSISAIALKVDQEGLQKLSSEFVDLVTKFTLSDDTVDLSMAEF